MNRIDRKGNTMAMVNFSNTSKRMAKRKEKRDFGECKEENE